MLKKVVNIFLGTVITQGSTILLYMVLARLLPVDDFATFRQLFLILGILTAVSFSALPTSLLYFTGRADSDGEKTQYLYLTAVLTVAISIALSISLYFFSGWIALLFNNVLLNDVLPWFALSVMGILTISMMPSVLLALNKTHLQVYLAASIGLSTTIPCITLAYYGADLNRIVQLLAAIYLLVGLLLAGALVYETRHVDRSLRGLKDKAIQVALYSWPLLAASGLSIVGLKIDHLFISSLLGVTVYGLYSVGAFEIPVFNILQNSVTSVLIPTVTAHLKRGRYQDATRIWSMAAKRTAWVTFPLASIFILYAEAIIRFLFGDQYLPAASIFAIFTSLVYVRVLSFGMALRALGKTKLELATTFFYLCTGGLGGYLTTAYFGATGTAIWVVINTLLLACGLSLLTLKCSGNEISIFAIYPKKELFFSLFLLIGMGAINEITTNNMRIFYVITLTNIGLLFVIWGALIRYVFDEKTA